ncbi:acyl-CoA dehydrogenase family protein [Natrinema halophilum]|uniref:acyl-CoA dehydrogenase family protein n=1 Tax=Natrinema halophilum TaxID=1699371 RepID=UPI001F2A48A2|nr:acyl-CoA dehydrogenase family protein [Natrinema halophilum]UHQ96291.1 acyl-CoA/acyl-ACP dehydrogenase [Natrinema halophilum]
MLDLSDEQQMLLTSVEQLAEDKFEKDAFNWEGETPWKNVKLLADRGYFGINYDEELGGGGLTEFEAILVVEAIGRVCPDTANFFHSQHLVGPRGIEMFGTQEAKEKYLPPVINGEDSIAVAISEPEAGSDVKSMKTTVEEKDGELILNGEKTWVSNVYNSSAAVVWVKFPEGLGSVVIELDQPGVEIGEHFTNMAGATQTQFFMNDVVVPEENVLTRERDAFKRQLQALNWERLGATAKANAWAVNAFEKALEYSKNREQFDKPIADFQGNEWKLADMAKNIEASRMLTYSAAQNAVEEGRIPDRLETSIAKLFSTEMIMHVTDEALQLHGANGYMQDHPLEYLYRLARGRRLGAGSDEIQRNTIASVIKSNGLPSHW